MTSGLGTQKRSILRISLVTGSTLATILGAQSLISLENGQLLSEALSTPPVEVEVLAQPANARPLVPAADPLLPASSTGNSVKKGQPATPATVLRAAPNIVILRHPAQQPAAPAVGSQTVPNSQSFLISPPSPVEVAPPAPVFVQPASPVIIQQAPSGFSAPSIPVTRSSR